MSPSIERGLERARDWALGPTDGLALDLTRRALAWALLLYTLAWGQNAIEWLTPAGFHPTPEVTRGLQMGTPLLGETTVWLFLAVYAGAIGCVILGIRPRVASVVVLMGLLYVSTADRLATFSMNKLFIAYFAVLACAPLARDERGEYQLRSVWPLRIMQATLILVYLGAGLCKAAYGDYFEHHDVLWYQLQLEFMTDLSAWMVRELPMWFFATSQWAALVFELCAPLLFIVPRLRPLGLAWGVAMHLLIGLTMYQVGYFAIQMICLYPLFVDPDLLRRVRDRIRPRESKPAPDAAR